MGDNGFAADYNVYKNLLGQLCDRLDEYMLLPADSPHQTIVEDGDYYRVTFAGDEMQFLRADTQVLPIRNVTVEELSRYLLAQLLVDAADEDLREIELCVASGPGQKGCTIWRQQ